MRLYIICFVAPLLLAGACLAQAKFARAVGGTGEDRGKSVVQTSDGGFAVAGLTQSFGAGNYDFFLVKFDAYGNTCIGSFVSPVVTVATPTVISPPPTVTSPSPTVTIVSPTVTVASPTFTEICTELDITEMMNNPQVFEISASPNPFNSSCVISAPAGTTIEIFDIDGKCIGSYDGTPLVWSPEDKIGSGVYFIRATLGGQVTTKRVVLVR